jgi:hypothetical protein
MTNSLKVQSKTVNLIKSYSGSRLWSPTKGIRILNPSDNRIQDPGFWKLLNLRHGLLATTRVIISALYWDAMEFPGPGSLS